MESSVLQALRSSREEVIIWHCEDILFVGRRSGTGSRRIAETMLAMLFATPSYVY